MAVGEDLPARRPAEPLTDKERMMPDMVRLEKVVKIYGEGSTEVRALRGVDLSIAPGEFSVVMGPSGSGKSTLLNLIGGLDRPTEGKVLIDGEETGILSRSRLSRIRLEKKGFVFVNILNPSYVSYFNNKKTCTSKWKGVLEQKLSFFSIEHFIILLNQLFRNTKGIK